MARKLSDTPQRNQRKHLLKAFPASYVKHGLNGTEAVLAIKPEMQRNSARALAPDLLAIPSIQERIRALLPSEEVEGRVIRDALTGDIQKEINWTERHKYLETSLKLKGLLNNTQDKSNVNVGIIIER